MDRPIDLVLMDVQMPGMDGLQALARDGNLAEARTASAAVERARAELLAAVPAADAPGGAGTAH